MTGRDAYEIWAPAGAQWASWARPVPFAAISGHHSPSAAFGALPAVQYAAGPQPNTAFILDIPGPDSIKEGVALAQMGFRPVPLFNGTSGQAGAMALVDCLPIESALLWGASVLKATTIPPNAPPVFLLDSNRTHRYKMDASVFDNSWDLYRQDMPSAGYFLAAGIHRVVVRGAGIQGDLRKILYDFQKKGLGIFFTDGYTPPKAIAVKRPKKMGN